MTEDRTSGLAALAVATTAELLDRDDVTLDDDFFLIGGDSMVAMHLVGRLVRSTGLRLRVSMVFEHPVLRDFVAQAARAEDARAD